MFASHEQPGHIGTCNAWGQRTSKNIESQFLTPKNILHGTITYHGSGRLNWTIKHPTSEGLQIPSDSSGP